MRRCPKPRAIAPPCVGKCLPPPSVRRPLGVHVSEDPLCPLPPEGPRKPLGGFTLSGRRDRHQRPRHEARIGRGSSPPAWAFAPSDLPRHVRAFVARAGGLAVDRGPVLPAPGR